MKITKAEFITSAPTLRLLPETEKTEIVLIGKSNVGKSSFINTFAGKKALAKVGSSPGKTQMANLFFINESFYIVDMPGYGYAKTNKGKKEAFKKLIDDYLTRRKEDFVVLFMLDIRHEPTKGDMEAYEKVFSHGITPLVILTKADKLSNMQRMKMRKLIAKKIQADEDELFYFSSTDAALSKDAIEMIEKIVN